jgi:hypothetical protein
LKDSATKFTQQRSLNGRGVNDGEPVQTANLSSSIACGSPDARPCALTAIAIQTPQTRDNRRPRVMLSGDAPAVPDNHAKNTIKLCRERTEAAPRVRGA